MLDSKFRQAGSMHERVVFSLLCSCSFEDYAKLCLRHMWVNNLDNITHECTPRHVLSLINTTTRSSTASWPLLVQFRGHFVLSFCPLPSWRWTLLRYNDTRPTPAQGQRLCCCFVFALYKNSTLCALVDCNQPSITALLRLRKHVVAEKIAIVSMPNINSLSPHKKQQKHCQSWTPSGKTF